jgi:acyl carrier protein
MICGKAGACRKTLNTVGNPSAGHNEVAVLCCGPSHTILTIRIKVFSAKCSFNTRRSSLYINNFMGRIWMLEKLKEIIWQYTDNRALEITEDTLLQSDLGLNSFELIQMISEVEETFNLVISDNVFRDLKTIKDVLDYIAAYT